MVQALPRGCGIGDRGPRGTRTYFHRTLRPLHDGMSRGRRPALANCAIQLYRPQLSGADAGGSAASRRCNGGGQSTLQPGPSRGLQYPVSCHASKHALSPGRVPPGRSGRRGGAGALGSTFRRVTGSDWQRYCSIRQTLKWRKTTRGAGTHACSVESHSTLPPWAAGVGMSADAWRLAICKRAELSEDRQRFHGVSRNEGPSQQARTTVLHFLSGPLDGRVATAGHLAGELDLARGDLALVVQLDVDRKSTRLNSSHL